MQSVALRWKALSERGMTTPILAIGYTYLAARALIGLYAKRMFGHRITAWILRHRRLGIPKKR